MTAGTVTAPQVQAGAPVQGPTAPTGADLLWATGTTAAAMDDAAASLREREAAAEAEQAAYTAAAHMGVEVPEIEAGL